MISEEDWVAARISWDDLVKIGVDHEENVPHLEASAELLANVIQRFSFIHSVRWRVKDVAHLLTKIVRKRSESNIKYEEISVDNYTRIVTDLIGIRGLHLFKNDCFEIDKSIRSSFMLTERPVAYVREGDDLDLREQYLAAELEVMDHPMGYRSIHYVLTTQPLKRIIHVEIQIRTVFEEGWSEIDHTVRYPNFSNNVQLAYLLAIFNRMAGSADEMGGFVRTLAKVLTDANLEIEQALLARDESVAKMEAAVEELAKKDKNKHDSEQITAVKTELSKLRAESRAKKGAEMVAPDILKWEVAVGIRRGGASETNELLKRVREIQGQSELNALLKAVEDPSGTNMLIKRVKETQSAGGANALVRKIVDPDGTNLLLKRVKEIQDPGGVTPVMKNLKSPPTK